MSLLSNNKSQPLSETCDSNRKMTIKVNLVSCDNQIQTHILKQVSLWDLISFVIANAKSKSLHIRIYNMGSLIPEKKLFYDV
jgi:hypothetical protein